MISACIEANTFHLVVAFPFRLIQRRAFFVSKKCIGRRRIKKDGNGYKHAACLNECCVKSIVQSPLGGSHLSKVVTLHASYSRLGSSILEVAAKRLVIVVEPQSVQSA